MAFVKMRAHISGGRGDGSEWPQTGEILECGDGEAADLIRAELAWPHDGAGGTPVAAEPQTAEPAADDTTETDEGSESLTDAQDDEDPNSPAVRAAKQEWVDHAVSQGFDRQVAESMTKKDLMSRFGK